MSGEEKGGGGGESKGGGGGGKGGGGGFEGTGGFEPGGLPPLSSEPGFSSGQPMNILPETASFTPSTGGEIFPSSGGETMMGGFNELIPGGGAAPMEFATGSNMPTEFSSVGTPGGTNQDIINSIMEGVDPGNQALINDIMTNVNAPAGGGPAGLTSESLGISAPLTAGGVSIANPTGALTSELPLTSSGSGGAETSAAGIAGTGGGTKASSSGGDPIAGKDLTSMMKSSIGNINPLSALLGGGALAWNMLQGQKTRPTTEALEKQLAENKALNPSLVEGANKLQAEGAALRGSVDPLMQEGAAIRQQGAELRDKAGNIIDKGTAMADYLATGTLPPSLQAQVDQTIAAKRTALISNYASQGMPTDPNKNSSLRIELGKLEDQKRILSGQLAQQLLGSGTQLIGSGTSLTGAGTSLTGAGTGLTGAGTSIIGAGSNVTQAGTQMLQAAQANTGLSTDILKTLANIDQTQTANMGKAIANFAASLSGKSGGINLKSRDMAFDDNEVPTGETKEEPVATEFSSQSRTPPSSADVDPPDPVGDLMLAVPPGMADIQRRKGEATAAVLTTAERRAEEDRGYMRQRFDAMGVETEKMKPWDHDKERKKFETSPIEAFGSYGSLFGLVASAFTRAPMENALNASAAAMNAIHEGNDKEYERAHTAWKDNMDLAVKRHNMMQVEFNDAGTLMKTDLSLGEAKAKNIATRFGDEQSLLLLEHGMSKEWFELQESRNKAITGAQTAAEAIDKRSMHDYFFKQMLDRAKETGADKDPSTVLRIWEKAHGIKPGSPEEEIVFRFMTTPKANGEMPTPEEMGKFYHDMKKQSSLEAITSDRLKAEEIRRRTRQYVDQGGMQENEAFDKATEEVTDASTASRANADQQFTRRFFKENPNATSEEFADAFGDFRKGLKKDPNLNADQTFIKQFYEANPDASPGDFSKAFGEFKKGQKQPTGTAGGNTSLTNDRQIAADVASFREKLKTSIDAETGEVYTPEKIGELAAARYAKLKSASSPITANKRDELRSHIDRTVNFEKNIDNIEGLLAKHNALTGIGGKVTRPAETIGNVLGVSNATDRAQFARWHAELKEWSARLLNESRGRPLAAEAANVDRIVAGMSMGDTTDNTVRAFRELRPLIQKIREDLKRREAGEWTPPPSGSGGGSTGSGKKPSWENAPIIAPGKRSMNLSDQEEIGREVVEVPPGENPRDYIPRPGAG